MVDIIPDPSVRKAMNEINAGNAVERFLLSHCINILFSVFFENLYCIQFVIAYEYLYKRQQFDH